MNPIAQNHINNCPYCKVKFDPLKAPEREEALEIALQILNCTIYIKEEKDLEAKDDSFFGKESCKLHISAYEDCRDRLIKKSEQFSDETFQCCKQIAIHILTLSQPLH